MLRALLGQGWPRVWGMQCAPLCVCEIGGEAAQSDSYGKYAMTTLKTKQHQLKFWGGFVVGRNAFYFLLGGLWSVWIGLRIQISAFELPTTGIVVSAGGGLGELKNPSRVWLGNGIACGSSHCSTSGENENFSNINTGFLMHNTNKCTQNWC